ncbi:MAG: zinc-dependent metalloprotease [Pirellulales bacterium]|nr:zinc-dependent metalloprotease [Pirellulales bacterium]
MRKFSPIGLFAPSFTSLVVVCALVCIGTVGWQSASYGEDFSQLLSAAAEGSESIGQAEAEAKKPTETPSGEKRSDSSNGATKNEDPGAKPAQATTSAPTSAPAKPKYPPYAELLKDSQKLEGLLTLHRKEDTLFAEISPQQMNRDFIVLITIARGIGQMPILGGFSWGFGDDAVWQFRKAGENIQLVRRNVRFTAEHGSPTERAVKLAYSDSVLFSLPIRAVGPQGSFVIDLTPVFMSDLPQIGFALPGFAFAANRSTWARVDVLPKNVELGVAATYASSGSRNIDSVPDTRGVTVNVHYSISELPQTSYRPRLADDRVGYFVTALKDFSKKESDDDRFVRYITRWNLEKADPSAEMSTPKEPIVFWLEKTIPFKYRKPIRDGILEWNKAFAKAGFYDAVEVRQQPDDATWEPGDIRYNTFRWITSEAGFAMGPSRVNPTTGQILDADIIFDSDFIQVWKQKYETFTPAGIAMLTGGAFDLVEFRAEQERLSPLERDMHGPNCACNLLGGMSQQLAMGASVVATRKRSAADFEKLLMQGLKDVAMHEVGHTFGLRHNFKASTLYTLKEANDVSKTNQTGLTSSVMDYTPINIMPAGETQGDYFSTTIGPYDMWAIEYGYKPLKAASPEAELPELGKIASRSGEKELTFSTDEDTRGIDPDPHSMRFDFTNDLVEYGRSQAKVVAECLASVVDDTVKKGEGYQHARQAFGILLERHGTVMFHAARYVGGSFINRSHKGDPNAPSPIEIVPAERQRAALTLLEEQVFSDKPFSFPPEMYNQLTSSKWDHWGTNISDRSDFPVHEVILMWQDRILSKLLSPLTLTRLLDGELKTPNNTDALTSAEVLERLSKAVYSEVDTTKEGEFTNRKPAISSLRRNLQRALLRRMSQLALGQTGAPEDCQTIAFVELGKLKTRIDDFTKGPVKLDSYSKAHLEETSARIAKVLDARMLVSP